MQWVGKALSSVTQYYKEINPATLSGAIDVIVVRRKAPDGSTELACSPFHVRFGKLSVLRPVDRKVSVTVNEKEIPFYMKVSDTGEAFFVFETEGDVPADLQTSPITGPVSDEDISSGNAIAESTVGEPDFLDLNELEAGEAGPMETNSPGTVDGSRRDLPLSHSSDALGPSSFLLADTIDAEGKDLKRRSSDADEDTEEVQFQEEEDLSPAMKHILGDTDEDHLGDDARAAQHAQMAKKTETRESVEHERSLGHGQGGVSDAGDVMLDMSGYKIGGNDAPNGREIDGELSSDGLEGRQGSESDEDLLSLAKALLRSAEMQGKPLGTAPMDDRDTAVGTSDQLESDKDRQTNLGSETMDDLQSVRFLLDVENKNYVFSLSLCGGPTFGENMDDEAAAFVRHQITKLQFLQDESIVTRRELVMKYRDRFLTWDNASTILASLALYRRTLALDNPELVQHDSGLSNGGVDQMDVQGNSWTRWWSRPRSPSGSGTPPNVDFSRPSSPPSSPPTSAAVSGDPETARTSLASQSSGVLQQPSSVLPAETRKNFAKTLRLTSDQLKQLELHDGQNKIAFAVRSSYSGVAVCTARIFMWEEDFSVVISDIDGTITKSDALGHVFNMIGRDWTHPGVAKLYTDIARNGYKIMYLTSRAIGQADTTREYLKGINQGNFRLPDGPVIMSPDRLITSLHREVVLRKPELFKMACLRDIQRLFGDRKPFYAGFGNRITDAISYRSVYVPSDRIFTIDSNGEVKMEFLELAGYKSSYIAMADLVDQWFPPINRVAEPEYTDSVYWRPPISNIDLPEFSPPSPALSARSDSSRLGLMRLGSLSLSRKGSHPTMRDLPPGSRSLPISPRLNPSSPLLMPSIVDEPEQIDAGTSKSALASRRLSSGSMPGSLPGSLEHESGFALEDDEEVDEDGDEEEEDSEDEIDDEDDEDNAAEPTGQAHAEEDFSELDFSSVPYL